MSGHRPWREVRDARLVAMTPEQRVEAERRYEEAKQELESAPPRSGDDWAKALFDEAAARGVSPLEMAEAAYRDASTGAAVCGHCHRPTVGYANADGVRLCQTGTLPMGAEPTDCYQLVTVAGHAADGSCCRIEPADG